MDFLIKLNPFTKAAVEMALWDIAGKALGVPVYQLLGGKLHDVIPTKMMIGAFDLPRVRSLAEQFLGWGIRCLKVKVGIDLAGDVARVRAVRELAGPEVPITIDANCGWTVTTARIALEQLRPFNVLVAEQPIAPGDTESMAYLRTVGGIPIMADESVFTLADAWNVLRAHAADVISVYPGKNGGIAGSIEIAHLAEAAGITCHVGSNLELGIGSAAMLHLAAAVPNIDSATYPADILGPHYHEADLLTEPLDLKPDGARVPDGPGLGVELDEEQLSRFRVLVRSTQQPVEPDRRSRSATLWQRGRRACKVNENIPLGLPIPCHRGNRLSCSLTTPTRSRRRSRSDLSQAERRSSSRRFRSARPALVIGACAPASWPASSPGWAGRRAAI